MTEATNPLDEIASSVPALDLWQPRDWPHRNGDEIRFDLHSFPLTHNSPGRRSHACENCGGDCLFIHDNVLCWRCKSTFCLHCTVTVDGVNANNLTTIPMSTILEKGFGNCHNCNEPLRSIALVDVFRSILEIGGPFIGADNPLSSHDSFLQNSGTSLVQEAEHALARATHCDDREDSISNFTHAINAINYMSSSTLGTGLVLRAKDILLIAHGKRAILENNQQLHENILLAYPKASVRSSSVHDTTFFLSRSAFESLFYPLPAKNMVGAQSDGSGFLVVDTRSQSCEVALASKSMLEQRALQDGEIITILQNAKLQDAIPSCQGTDPIFNSLGGTFKGVYIHQISRPPLPSVELGGKKLDGMLMFIQFIRVFPTTLAASEYTRVMIENKKIGEEGPPLKSKSHQALRKLVIDLCKNLQVSDLKRVHVLLGECGPSISISVVASIGNISTKVFINVMSRETNEACHFVAKAFSYLDKKLSEVRATSQSLIKEAHHNHDLTICAYCGKGEGTLQRCSRCKLTMYCSRGCQKQHWTMKGPFAHRRSCERGVSSSGSIGPYGR